MRWASLAICAFAIWPPSLAWPSPAEPSSFQQAEVERHREQALLRLREGDLQAALSELNAALALAPDAAPLHDALGVMLGEAGRIDAAVIEFREAARLDSRSADIRFHLGLALERIERPREALAEYERALSFNPELLEARYGLSSVCAKLGDVNGAIALLRDVIDALPQFAEARYNLGLNLWARYTRSQGSRQKQDLDEAVDALTTASALEPRQPTFHAALGQLLAETQDLALAADHLKRAIELAPDDGEHAYALGLVRRLQGDLDGAEAQFRAATGKNPRHADAYRALGLVLRQQGDYAHAAEALRRSLEERPGDAQGHHLLGTVLLKLDRVEDAVSELRAAVGLNGGLTEARVTLAQTLAKIGRRDEAREQQAEIERINVENAENGRMLVLLQTAAARLKRGETTTAIGQLREAAALGPGVPETHYQLGLALERSPATSEEAERAFRRVLELSPDHAGAHHRLGLLLARRDPKAAATELWKALEIEPGLVDARRALARLAADAADWTTAVVELQTVIVWDPQSADAHVDLAGALRSRGDAEAAARETAIARRLKASPRR